MTDLQPAEPNSKRQKTVTALAAMIFIAFLGCLYVYLKDMVIEEVVAQDDPFRALVFEDGQGSREAEGVEDSFEPFSSKQLKFHEALLGKSQKRSLILGIGNDDGSERTVADYILLDSSSSNEKKKRLPLPENFSEVYENELVKNNGRYTVHVTSFEKRKAAGGLVKLLESREYPAYMTWRNVEDRGVTWRVRVGPFKYLRDANKAQARLEKEERIHTFVFHHRKKKKS